VGKIARILTPLTPAFIYMRPDSIHDLYVRLGKVRGQSLLGIWVESHGHFPYAQSRNATGYSGFLKFWQDFRELSDQVFGEIPTPKLQLDVAGACWDSRYRQMLDFLDLPIPDLESESLQLERFAGVYTSLDQESTIRVGDQCLIVTCDQPLMDVEAGPIGCFRESRIVPTGKNSFSIAGWPHEIEFLVSKNGAISGMRVSVSGGGWCASSMEYVRQ